MSRLLSSSSYLQLTPKGFFFRMRVPKHLQAKIGKRELKKTIAGADRLLAERQAILYASRAFTLFDALEDNPLSSYRFDMVVEVGRSGTKFHLDKNNTKQELQMLVEQGIIKPQDELPDESHALPAYMAAPLTVTIGTTDTEGAPPPISERMLLSQAVHLYLDDLESTNNKFDEHRRRELQAKFDLLREIIGDKPIGAIVYYDAKKYRDTYQKLPRNRTSAARKKMSIEQLIKLDDPVKNSKDTINQRLETMSSLFNWLKRLIPPLVNPFVGMGIKNAEGDTHTKAKIAKRLPFDNTDLSKLFSDRIWTQQRHDNDWEYWLPLMLLYTGARVTEICQLEKADFSEQDGVWVMSINDEPTTEEPEQVWHWEKRVKTGSSVRDIPIHNHLLELGLREFVESSPSQRLFPNIKPVAGKLASYPCKKFNDYVLVRADVKVKNVKTLYSMRHTTLNALKQQRVSSEERAQVAGHVPQSNNTTESVYGGVYSIAVIKELVEKLDFSEQMKKVLPWNDAARLVAIKKRRVKRPAK